MIIQSEILTLRIRVTGGKNKDERREELNKKLSLLCKWVQYGEVSWNEEGNDGNTEYQSSFKIESV